MGLIYIFLCLLFTCISIQALRPILRKPPAVKLPPGPKGFPVIGNLLELGDKPHKSLAKLALTHGPLMSLKLGQVTTIVISSASMAREVLQRHDLTFSSRTVPDTIRAHEHNQYSMGWMPVTPMWRNLRKICNTNIFTSQKLDDNQHLRSKKVQQLVTEVQESCRLGATVDIGQAAFKAALNLLSNTIFSVDLADQNSDTAREFKKEVDGITQMAGKPNIADYFPVLRKIDPQGARRRMDAHYGNIFALFGRMIDRRLGQKSNSSNDMLDALINISREGNLDRIYIEHLLIDLFVAGTDTTSNTVEWVMAELLHNPEKLRKAQAELEQSIGRGNPVKEADITRFHYLDAVVKETMRLHPVAPLLLPRKAEDDVQIGGFTIPKGAQVLVNAWAMGRDPAIWENPYNFVPERFLGSKVDVKGRDFELIPFGAGRRICPGMPLAMRMVHMMVASLIHGFDWKLEDGTKAEEMNMEDKFGITLAMAQPLGAIPITLT